MLRLCLPVAALAAMSSMTASADLRTYDVEPQYQQEVFTALKDVLTMNPEGGMMLGVYGRVELLPSGQILVNAPPETLEQVEQVLQTIRARSVAATPRVSLRYWAVLGAAAENLAARDTGVRVEVVPNEGSAPRPPVSPILNVVLDELRQIHGNLTFRVLGTAAIAANSGQFGAAAGWPLSVQQTAHVQDNTLNAEISMELTGLAPNTVGNSTIGNLVVRTNLGRGEFVVLGESYVRFAAGEEGPVFYIVHWER